MAFPAVQGRNNSSQTAISVTHVVNLPASILAAETLIVAISYSETGNSFTWPAGWNQFPTMPTEQATGALQGVTAAWSKATGSETATITVTAGVATRGLHRSWRINAATDPTVTAPEALGANAANAQADPPSLSPTGGAKDYLWLAVGGNSHGDVYTGFPTDYTNTFTDTTLAGGGAGHCVIGTCERLLNAATEDPGPFAGANVLAEMAAATIAVYPTAEAPPVVSDANLAPVIFGRGAA